MPQLSAKQLAAIPQELKEAVCNALVETTVSRVSGRGPSGKVLFGSSPRRLIVSGQLLPRFNQGIDLQSGDERLLETTPEQPETPADGAQQTSTGDGTNVPDDTTARLRIGTMLQRGRHVPTGLLEPAQIPSKWLRVDLTAPSFA